MKYLLVKDKQIPIEIKSYKTSKSVRIYFKGNTLTITKPTRLPQNMLLKMLKEEEEDIYNKYLKITSSEISSIKQWKTGETIYYKGEKFDIIREEKMTSKIGIKIDEQAKKLELIVPKDLSQDDIKANVDKGIKKIFKNNTEAIIARKLPYWSKVTNLNYNDVKIRDATTRYGSCMPNKRNLYFSSRLVMLPEDKIDAIIVHELCHIKYKYHNEQFYNLVSTYIPNYGEIDKWLKKYGNTIMF